MGKGNRVSGARVLSLAAQMRPFFSLLPLEGGAPKGRRLAACNGTPTFAEANPASLRSSAPSRGRGANDFSGNTDSIVAIRDLGLALPPHMSRTSPLSSSVFHTACALSAPAGHLPLEGKAAIRESPLLKKVAHHPCEPIRSPSTVIPSAAEGSLLHCRHMHTCALTQTTPWCFLFRLSLAHDLPLCKKDPSTSVGMTFKGNG